MPDPDRVTEPRELTVVTAVVTCGLGVLLCRRLDGRPEWSFPGGELEAGETVEQCAVRETAEETGLEVVVGARLGERVHPRSGRFMIYFAATPDGSDTRVKVGDPDEHDEVRWVPWTQAQALLPGLFEPVEAYLRGELGG